MENEKLKELKTITYSIKNIRINKEIAYQREKVDKFAPQAIAGNDNVFQKFGKNAMNTIKKSDFDNCSKKLEKAKVDAEKLIDCCSKENITIIENFEDLENKIKDLFKDDKFQIAKLEMEMNIILDHDCDYVENDDSFEVISKLLSEKEDYLSDLEKEMSDAYIAILNNKSETIKKATIVAGCASLPFIVGGAFSLVGGIGIAHAIALMTIGSCIGGGAIGYGAYLTMNEIQKLRIKESFNKLSVEETAISLVRTIMSLKQLNNYYEDKDAKDIYDSYIENYIDLKSDLDLRLFMEKENVPLNCKKNEMFHNSDRYLKKVLKLDLRK